MGSLCSQNLDQGQRQLLNQLPQNQQLRMSIFQLLKQINEKIKQMKKQIGKNFNMNNSQRLLKNNIVNVLKVSIQQIKAIKDIQSRQSKSAPFSYYQEEKGNIENVKSQIDLEHADQIKSSQLNSKKKSSHNIHNTSSNRKSQIFIKEKSQIQEEYSYKQKLRRQSSKEFSINSSQIEPQEQLHQQQQKIKFQYQIREKQQLKINSLQEKCKSYQIQIQKLKSESQKQQSIETDDTKKKIKQKLDQALNQILQLKQSLENEKKSHEQAKQSVKKLQNQIDELNTSISQLKSQIQDKSLKQEEKDYSKQYTSLLSQNFLKQNQKYSESYQMQTSFITSESEMSFQEKPHNSKSIIIRLFTQSKILQKIYTKTSIQAISIRAKIQNMFTVLFGDDYFLDQKIVQTKLLFSFDKINPNKYSQYINGKNNLFLIAQFEQDTFFGGFIHHNKSIQKPTKQSFLYSIRKGSQPYILKALKQIKPINEMNQYLNFGSNQIKIKSKTRQCQINIGCVGCQYKTLQGKTPASYQFLKSNQTKFQVEEYEIYQIVLGKEKY